MRLRIMPEYRQKQREKHRVFFPVEKQIGRIDAKGAAENTNVSSCSFLLSE